MLLQSFSCSVERKSNGKESFTNMAFAMRMCLSSDDTVSVQWTLKNLSGLTSCCSDRYHLMARAIVN